MHIKFLKSPVAFYLLSYSVGEEWIDCPDEQAKMLIDENFAVKVGELIENADSKVKKETPESKKKKGK